MTVEITSAASITGGAWAVPDNIHSRAQLILERCVQGTSPGGGVGLGGSATLDFQQLAEWAVINPVDPLYGTLPPVPASASFFTITISGPTDKLHSPGDYNPIVPWALRDANERAYDSEANQRLDSEVIGYLDRANFWSAQAEAMSVAGDTLTSWWQSQPWNSSRMIYQCDAALGNPSPYDCGQVQLSQINVPGDLLTVGPGIMHFLHSNTCFVAVSATVNYVLTWSQIRIAIAALVGACVNTPYHTTSVGGKAYYKALLSPQSKDSNNVRDKPKNTGEFSTSGLNALPPGTNVTIFQQLEPWTNASDEMRSCTWLAVSNERSVKSCPGVV